MKRHIAVVVLIVLGMTLLLAGCAQPSTPATPTAAPAAATKAPAPAATAAPTKAPAAAPSAVAPTAAPTAAPAQKASWPASGRSITYIIPFAAGGSTDLVARIVAPYLEKKLGIPVSVVNKAGGNTQVGMTELATAKPDGYTIGTVDIPAANITYMLPDRGAVYTAKSFMPLAILNHFPPGWVVKADSRFKTVKDVIDAAKAQPGAITVGDSGLLNSWHLSTLSVEKAAGISLRSVHFDGGGPSQTALLGGHIDIATNSVLNSAAALKAGQVRIVGIMGTERDKFNPGIPTFKEQGYDVAYEAWYTVAVPAGTPKEVADILASALNKVTANPEFKKKADELQATMAPPMTPAQIEKLWTDYDVTVKPLVDAAVAKQ